LQEQEPALQPEEVSGTLANGDVCIKDSSLGKHSGLGLFAGRFPWDVVKAQCLAAGVATAWATAAMITAEERVAEGKAEVMAEVATPTGGDGGGHGGGAGGEGGGGDARTTGSQWAEAGRT